MIEEPFEINITKEPRRGPSKAVMFWTAYFVTMIVCCAIALWKLGAL